MTLKTLIVSSTLALTSLASAQYYGGGNAYGVNVGFGGSYNRTNISGPNGGSTTITNTSLGGGIGVGVAGGGYYGGAPVYGGGYGGGYYGGGYAPSILPYGGCAPAYVPYSPFTNTWGNPCYPPAVVVAPVVYGGGCGQAWVR